VSFEPACVYDRYWASRDRPRAEARSRERGALAARLLIEAGAAGRRVLDAGCGPGWTLEELARAGFQATGADVSPAAVDEARSRGLEARVADLSGHPDDLGRAVGGSYDAVLLLEVLEHLLDPLAALGAAFKLLAPGGLLAVSLPNEVSLASRLRVLAGRLPFGGHDDPHVRHFDRRLARRLFAAAGAKVLAERPVSIFPPSWKLIRTAAAPLLSVAPGAFSIASIYILRPEGAHAP